MSERAPATPRTYDCFTFFNELDVLEIRLAELDPLVDRFVLVEATRTFMGSPKPLVFSECKARFAAYAHKITHVVVDDLPDSSNPWVRERAQRRAIMRGLQDARPDDRIIVSDVDEIPKPRRLAAALSAPMLSRRLIAFWCENYTYRLNLRNDDLDHRLGPRLLTYRNLTDPNGLREISVRFSRRKWLRPFNSPVSTFRLWRHMPRTPLLLNVIWDGAWHFTSIGDVDDVNHKLSSYSHAPELTALITKDEFEDNMYKLQRWPVVDLPRAVQSGRYAKLLA
ncbi:N-acetylglucosaminyltransferase [Bradyrhizobium sp.]|uniref:N-acetylglucosaminyltransferase n=1 Tax=Bradyrhizobium sp. TaxID=376 RepID=UPI0025BBAD38|nr:N-acetylglucosaminyltransferase [Bradyrhizobium sp.]